MLNLSEPLPNLFTSSRILRLNFADISNETPLDENIRCYFKNMIEEGMNPRLPENRQSFNDYVLAKNGVRYLVGGYAEDRLDMLADTPAGSEGRTVHMAIDIFAKNLEPVLAPCDGEIICSGYEEGFGEYGNYLILKPDQSDLYIFLGHLSDIKSSTGRISEGDTIAHLGDYLTNENGGWSRHLHLQILTELPGKNRTPAGYSTLGEFDQNKLKFPNPLQYFSNWHLR